MTCWKAHSEFSRREAVQFLKDGSLPENFRQRVATRLLAACDNCDDVKDMNVVMRAWYEEGQSLCDDCLDVPVAGEFLGGRYAKTDDYLVEIGAEPVGL